MAPSSFIADLKEAVDRELAIKQQKGLRNATMQIKDGLLISQLGESTFVYRFESFTGTPPEEGTKVEVNIGNESISGRIAARDERGFLLELNKDFGTHIATARLNSDPLFLLKMQSAFLSNLSPANKELAPALALLDEGSYVEVRAIDTWQENVEGLNHQQAEAVRTLRLQPRVFIWGPPGTGKTTTIGSVVATAVASGLRVLLVSNTNSALDTAMEATLPKVNQKMLEQNGSILRVGPILKSELRDKWGEYIDFEKVLGRQTEEIRVRLQVENFLRSEILARGKALNEVVQKWTLIWTKKKEYESLELQTSANISERESLISKRANSQNSINTLLEEIKANKSKGFIAKLRSRSEKAIQSDITSAKSALASIDRRIEELKRNLPDLQSQLTINKEEFKKISQTQSELPDYQQTETKLKAAKAELDSCQQRIKNIEEELKNARTALLSSASIVGCTAYRPLIDPDLSPVKFDLVVIDEASMLPLSLLLIAASRSIGRIVVAGDFRQLPPIISLGEEGLGSKSSERDKFLGSILSQDAFHKSGVIQRFNAGEKVPELVSLYEQYRMRTEISDLVTQRFYPDHPLKTMNERRDLSTPWGNSTFVTFNTENLEPESNIVGTSRRNVIHAITVERIVEELVLDGWTLDGTKPNSIGVISPYKEQAKHTQRLLDTRFGSIAKGASQTIHKFQGSERGLVVIDMTKVGTREDPGLGRWQANNEPFSNTNLKWNVALSRAQQHLIVVSHRPTVEQSANSVIANILKEIEEKGILVEADTLFQGNLREKLPKKLTSVDPQMLGIFKADDFYPAFTKDLKECKKSLLISSPFVTRNGVERWITHLEKKISTGVQVTLLTKPLNEGMNKQVEIEIHSVLRTMGVILRLESGIHEKIAIIDENITWHGSLNIMSHTYGTSEIMARFDSPEIAADIAREIANPSIKPLRNNARSPGSSTRKYSNIQALGDNCLRPGCDGKMQNLKVNRTTGEEFLSCSNYGNPKNRCGWTANRKIS